MAIIWKRLKNFSEAILIEEIILFLALLLFISAFFLGLIFLGPLNPSI